MKLSVTPGLLGIIFLLSCKPVYTVQKTENSEYILSDTSNSQIDTSINSFIVPYREKVTGTMSAILVESEMPLEKVTRAHRHQQRDKEKDQGWLTAAFFPAPLIDKDLLTFLTA